MRVVRARLDNCVVAIGTRTPSAVLGRRNDAFMRAGWDAVAMEPNAYHKAEDLNDNDNANMYGHSHSFVVEVWTDIKVSTIIGIEARIVKQTSSWRPAGITWVRVEPRAAALTLNTAANTSDETSWDLAKARSWADGIAKLFHARKAGHCL